MSNVVHVFKVNPRIKMITSYIADIMLSIIDYNKKSILSPLLCNVHELCNVQKINNVFAGIVRKIYNLLLKIHAIQHAHTDIYTQIFYYANFLNKIIP